MTDATKRALIFGSQGSLGKELVKTYRTHGWQVEEVTRSECDFAVPAQAEEFTSRWLSQNSELDHCIFAVGKLFAGHLKDLPSSAWRDCASINAASPLLITRALQRSMAKPPKFIYLGSGASEVILPGLLPYAAAKGLLKDSVRAMHLELKNEFNYLWVWPGGIEGQFNEKAVLYGGYSPPRQRSAKSPAELAEKIFAAAQRNPRTLTVSSLPLWMGRLQRICPSIVDLLFKFHQK